MLYLKIPVKFCSELHRASLEKQTRDAVINGRPLPSWAIDYCDADRITVVEEKESQS
jgi:hypothetical protein